MLVKLYFFNFFRAKKAEKRTKVRELRQNFAKHVFFQIAPEHWTWVLFPDKVGSRKTIKWSMTTTRMDTVQTRQI